MIYRSLLLPLPITSSKLLLKATPLMLVIATVLTEQCQAQDSTSHKTKRDSITFGLQVGLSFNHFSGEGVYGYDPVGINLVRFRGGGNVDFPLAKGLSFRPGLLLSWKGYKTQDSVSYKTELMYINIPADLVIRLANFSHVSGRRANLNLGAGIYGGYALHGIYVENSHSTRVTFSNDEVPSSVSNYGAYYKSYDAGLDFFLEFTGNSFYSQIGTTIGLVNIKPPLANSTAPQPKYHNVSINLTYGWRL